MLTLLWTTSFCDFPWDWCSYTNKAKNLIFEFLCLLNIHSHIDYLALEQNKAADNRQICYRNYLFFSLFLFSVFVVVCLFVCFLIQFVSLNLYFGLLLVIYFDCWLSDVEWNIYFLHCLLIEQDFMLSQYCVVSAARCKVKTCSQGKLD